MVFLGGSQGPDGGSSPGRTRLIERKLLWGSAGSHCPPQEIEPWEDPLRVSGEGRWHGGVRRRGGGGIVSGRTPHLVLRIFENPPGARARWAWGMGFCGKNEGLCTLVFLRPVPFHARLIEAK
jgi:hypothetical protein